MEGAGICATKTEGDSRVTCVAFVACKYVNAKKFRVKRERANYKRPEIQGEPREWCLLSHGVRGVIVVVVAVSLHHTCLIRHTRTIT